jgi:glycosyltransferase involved in cell wall biosynthesis
MGLTGYHTIQSLRHRYLKLTPVLRAPVSIYHNFWGLPLLADLDPSERRLGFLHTNTADMRACLLAQKGLIDGVVCVSAAQIQLLADCLPELGKDRICRPPLPIRPLAPPQNPAPMRNRPVVIGYSGRLIKDLKRIDRLPEIVKHLEAAEAPFRFELLGNGPDRAWIEREFAGNSNVLIHGEKTGPDYWRIMSRWDFILFVSDTEGTPLALLEAMACGVLPIYPRIGSGGDEYVQKVSEALFFELRDLNHVASIVHQFMEMPHNEAAQLRARCRELLSDNLGDGYLKMFREFTTQIQSLPRISSCLVHPRLFLATDYVPFGLIRRYMPWACYARR